ncbi:MAG: monovalent cation/H+ antiporter complex subunit F [Bacillota bacterium]
MLQAVLWISLVGLAVALLLAGYRTFRGPTVPDRIVALDIAGTLLIHILIVGSILLNDPHYLAYAVVLAAINYVSTVALGKYIQRGGVIGRADSDRPLPAAGNGGGGARDAGPRADA